MQKSVVEEDPISKQQKKKNLIIKMTKNDNNLTQVCDDIGDMPNNVNDLNSVDDKKKKEFDQILTNLDNNYKYCVVLSVFWVEEDVINKKCRILYCGIFYYINISSYGLFG